MAGMRCPASRLLAAAVLPALLAACGGGGGSGDAPPVPRIAVVSAPATATVGVPFASDPVVQLTAASGAPLATAGVQVTIALTGGGSLLGTTLRPTDGSGRAAFPGLTATGLAAGSRTLTFTAAGYATGSGGSFEVAPGPAAQLAAASSTSQQALPSTAVADPPAVFVLDAAGNGVGGVPVTFAVSAGGGAVAGGAAVSGAGGFARSGGWTLGPALGLQAAQATSTALAGAAVTFSATAVTAVSPYHLAIRYQTALSATQRAAFERAQAKVQAVVRSALSAVSFPAIPAGDCGNAAAQPAEVVDGLVVYATVKLIDGPGGTIAQSGPCYLRSTSQLPIVGLLEFDSADLATYEARGQLETIVLHELLHVVGYGTIWPDLGLLDKSAPADQIFTGPAALAAFNGSNGGGSYTGRKVPVESTGGAGTVGGHWRETVFKNELMTGFISGTTQPMSLTTVMSLQDLGYAVDPAQAAPFNWTTAGLRAAGAPAADEAPIDLGGDLLPRAPLLVDDDGTIRPRLAR